MSLVLCLAACGGGGGDGDQSDGTGGDLDPADAEVVAVMGMRRLSRHEYDRTLETLLGDASHPGSALLPEDPLTPFDNEAEKQVPSLAYVEAAEVVGREAAARLVADPARRDAVVGCAATGPNDATCMETFVTAFGRRALRRSLSAAEVDEFTTLGLDTASETGTFDAGVEVVTAALLLDPEFLYRIERGDPVDGSPDLFKLNGNEVATRLSYFLTGTTPSDRLLDAAEAGELDSPAGVETVARELLGTDDARTQVDRFHALWIGYTQLPIADDLGDRMRTETRRLLDDVVFDDARSWLEVFTANGTFVDDVLARHYGLVAPGSNTPTWVGYADSGRAGLLSHGSFLAIGGGAAQTSPTRRGKLIRTRLMCQQIPPPPPDVDADAPPPADAGACKEDRYAAHRQDAGCASCHQLMDPLGFGLENYDYAGQFRSEDPAEASCQISGDGEVAGIGSFNGPAQLAQVLIDNEILDACVVEQLYRYAMGQLEDSAGSQLIDELATNFSAGGHRFDGLVIDLVAHPSFGFRREEQQ